MVSQVPLDDGPDRGDKAEAICDELKGVGHQIADISTEVDDQLAECRFDLVKESLEHASALVKQAEQFGIKELARLCVGLGDTRSLRPTPLTATVPRLSNDDLPALPLSSAIDDDQDYHEELVAALRTRVNRTADHIRRLLDRAEAFWQLAIEAAEAGDSVGVDDWLKMLGELSIGFPEAYALWEVCLAGLYDESPSNLGYVGDMVASVETWLGSRKSPDDLPEQR